MTRTEYQSMHRIYDPGFTPRTRGLEFELGMIAAQSYLDRCGAYLDGLDVCGDAAYRDGVDALAYMCGRAAMSDHIESGAVIDEFNMAADGATDAWVAGAADYALSKVDIAA